MVLPLGAIPLVWKGASALSAIILLVFGAQVRVDFRYDFAARCMTLGASSGLVERTLGWSNCSPSV